VEQRGRISSLDLLAMLLFKFKSLLISAIVSEPQFYFVKKISGLFGSFEKKCSNLDLQLLFDFARCM